MASSAAAPDAPPLPDVDDRVYRAVVARESPKVINRIIEEVAQGDDARRVAAVNKPGKNDDGEDELPMAAAVRLYRRAVIAVLLEAGADAKLLRSSPTALALCVNYGLIDTLRKLLRAGHDPRERHTEDWWFEGAFDDDDDDDSGEEEDVGLAGRFTTAAHECCKSDPCKLRCLEIFVREGGVDVSSPDWRGATLLHLCARYHGSPQLEATLDLLVSFGADVEARDGDGATPMFGAAEYGDPAMIRALVSRGASVNVRGRYGRTPLISAADANDTPARADTISELLRLSSVETRRASPYGQSAADSLVDYQLYDDSPFDAWHIDVLSQMLASGATLKPENASRLLPFAARLARRREAQVTTIERSAGSSWRLQDEVVQLAFDFVDLRGAEEAVRRRERRVRELEDALGVPPGKEASGSGSGSGSKEETSSAAEKEEQDDMEEDEEQGGSVKPKESGSGSGSGSKIETSGAEEDEEEEEEGGSAEPKESGGEKEIEIERAASGGGGE